MLSYTLKVTICWLACYLLYHWFLRRETFFRINRWYLTTSILLGLLIPVIDLQALFGLSAVVPVTNYLQPITIGVEQLETVVISNSSVDDSFDWWLLIQWIYFIGVSIAFAKFSYGLSQLFKLYQNGEIEKRQGYHYVSTKEDHVPFSFFKHLFWSKKFQVEDNERAAILRHEKAHISQRHSLDVLFVEILGVIFWWSPPIYFFQRAMKTNHEYLADEAVLRVESRKFYGRILLKQFQPNQQLALSNSLFSSQLKNRIIMMTKTKSTQSASWKYFIGLPLIALLFLAFSFANEKNKALKPSADAAFFMVKDTMPDGEIFKEVEESPRFPGCENITDIAEQKKCTQERMLEFIYSNLKYPEEARKLGIDGMVVVNFVIEKDGSIDEAEIKRSIGGGCGDEVLKVVYMMPNWVPGKQGGEAVRTSFYLPVKFKLEAGNNLEKKKTDEMPRFVVGCENVEESEQVACSKKQLINYILKNMRYPEESKKAGIEGMVVASFTIAKDGALEGAQVVRSVDEHCDAEVLRILSEMPKWTPGMKDGKPVAVEMNLPFKFALSENNKPSAHNGNDKNMASEMEFFQVYPNPASDKLFVKFKTERGSLSLGLADVNGKELASQIVSHDGEIQTVEVVLDKLPRGTVFVSLANQRGDTKENATIVLK